MSELHTVPLTIEEARVDDVAEITEVHMRAEQSIYPETRGHFALPSREEIEEYHEANDMVTRWQTAREHEIFYEHNKQISVARMGEVLVGFSVYDTQINWLNSLYVAPEYQGYGIGSRLLKNCLRLAGQNPTKLLTIEHSSAAAFYEKRGFSTGDLAPIGRKTQVNETAYIPLIGMVYIP